MHKLLKRRRTMLGIYVNEKGITLCQTSVHKRSVSIDKIACKEGNFPTEEVGLEVYKLLKEYNFNANRANIGISYGDLIKSYLELPYMPPKHTFKYIKYELQRLYKIDPNVYKLWFYTLNVKPHSDYYSQRVVIFGISKHLMRSYETQFERSGLRINSFISPLDAQLIILKNITADIIGEKDVVCFVHIEDSSIDICFYYDEDIISMTTISTVGRDINYLEDELKLIFNYFYIENYGTNIDIVILSGNCYRDEEYLTLFAKLGYRSIWLSDEILKVKYKVDSKAFPIASYINAIGSSIYY